MSRAIVAATLLVALILGRQSIAVAGGGSGSDECLVEIHDSGGALADGTTLCQTATRHVCTFDLALCLNQPDGGCAAANFTGRTFRATGHCGPVGQLRVTASGTSSACGAFTGVNVRTRSSGKAPGRCTIRAEVRSAKVHARTDVDTVTLVCMPPGTSCPAATTTTISPGTTTTSIPPGTTTTTVSGLTTTTGPGTTSTTVVGGTTTTSMTGSTTTTTMGSGFTRLSFTTATGTTSCGSGGLGTPPSAPSSGALASDTSCATKITDLGL